MRRFDNRYEPAARKAAERIFGDFKTQEAFRGIRREEQLRCLDGQLTVAWQDSPGRTCATLVAVTGSTDGVACRVEIPPAGTLPIGHLSLNHQDSIIESILAGARDGGRGVDETAQHLTAELRWVSERVAARDFRGVIERCPIRQPRVFRSGINARVEGSAPGFECEILVPPGQSLEILRMGATSRPSSVSLMQRRAGRVVVEARWGHRLLSLQDPDLRQHDVRGGSLINPGICDAIYQMFEQRLAAGDALEGDTAMSYVCRFLTERGHQILHWVAYDDAIDMSCSWELAADGMADVSLEMESKPAKSFAVTAERWDDALLDAQRIAASPMNTEQMYSEIAEKYSGLRGS